MDKSQPTQQSTAIAPKEDGAYDRHGLPRLLSPRHAVADDSAVNASCCRDPTGVSNGGPSLISTTGLATHAVCPESLDPEIVSTSSEPVRTRPYQWNTTKQLCPFILKLSGLLLSKSSPVDPVQNGL